VALSKKLYLEHHDSRASLQAVATASTLLINSPLSTQVEKLAGRLLHLVGEHPDTHTEYLIDRAVGDKALGITLEDAARYAEQKKSLTEAALIETAQLLCEFSGVSLPLWMNTHKEQSAPEQSLTTPAPPTVAEVVVTEGFDFSLLATRGQLITAFGPITRMDESWFGNLETPHPLYNARKLKGTGGHNSVEPLFCPFEVMTWLTKSTRKKGRPISETTAWNLLKGNFPKVYKIHSKKEPNDDWTR
jgi:hypothetical protein